MMSTQHTYEGKKIIFTKGAIDSILKVADRILINGKERKITKEDKEILATLPTDNKKQKNKKY